MFEFVRRLAVGKPSILVVEDNPLSRATAVDMFKNLGFTVLDAYNGITLWRCLRRVPRSA